MIEELMVADQDRAVVVDRVYFEAAGDEAAVDLPANIMLDGFDEILFGCHQAAFVVIEFHRIGHERRHLFEVAGIIRIEIDAIHIGNCIIQFL